MPHTLNNLSLYNDQIPIIIPALAVLGLHLDILQDKRSSNPTTRLVEGRNGETSECAARLAPLCSTVTAIKMQMSSKNEARWIGLGGVR